MYAYLPSEEARTKWEGASRAAGMSLSRFFVDVVEGALREWENEPPRTSGRGFTGKVCVGQDLNHADFEAKFRTNHKELNLNLRLPK